MDPKVSVTTICYNAEEFIENAINNVLKQTHRSLEYIVIDGNSKDNTLAIISEYKSKISYFLSEFAIIYEAMNKGIRVIPGEIFCFLNYDVLHDKHIVENSVKLFQNNIKTELFYNIIIIKNFDIKASFFKTSYKYKKSFFIGNCICQRATFYKGLFFTK